MARTHSVSDEEILTIAHRVMNQRGIDGFTISEVAAEAGLSRAAITLRFGGTNEFKVVLLRQSINQFFELIESFPTTPGGDSLLEVAAILGGIVESRQSLTAFFNRLAKHIRDPDLLKLELERGQKLHAAILRITPDTRIPRESVARAFQAHITGTLFAWQTSEEPSCKSFIVKRTQEWLQLAHIPYAADLFTDKVS